MPRPTPLHLAALLLLVVMQLWFGTYRISPIDVPEHLAVGRILWEQMAPMTTNQISWTHPDYPNHNQYPLYQLVLYLCQDRLGFWSLSALCCASWAAAVGAWARWAGGWREAAWHAPLWLMAVVAVQRHLVPRPEVVTLLGLGLLLLAYETWRARPRTGPLAAMVGTLWVMVQCHQMYVFGFLLVGGFVVHLTLTRALAGRGWVDDRDAALPVGPLAAALVACFLVMALSPLGWRAWVAPWTLVATVLKLGAPGAAPEADELRPIWDEPVGGPLTALLLGVVALAGWRSRGRWQVLELGVLAMGLGMVAMAMRGIPFFGLAAAAVVSRWWQRSEPFMPEATLLRATTAGVTLFVGGALLSQTMWPRPHEFFGNQQGMGKSVGEWAEEGCAFLRENPPPGEMLNIGWAASNYLNFDVYPVKRVFVDARWEAFPMDFLQDALAAQRDQEVLDRLIETWQPGFVVAEMRDPNQQDRLATLVQRGWSLVYVDSLVGVAVRPGDDAQAYVAAHVVDLDTVELLDALPEHPVLHAQQKVRLASFLRRMGRAERADALRAEAAQVAHPGVAAHLRGFE